MKVYHLHLKLPFRHKQTTDYYFSSMAAIYQQFTPDQLGVAYSTLRKAKLRLGPYENEKCLITMGGVTAKKKQAKTN